LRLGEIGPSELIDGMIVPMAPTGGERGVWESRIGRLIGNFVDARGLGWVLTGEVGIYTRRDPDRVRGADVVFLSRKRSPDPPPKGFLTVAPDVVVDVVSPEDRWQHLRDKLDEYFDIGVGEVWVVEPSGPAVLVYKSPVEVARYAARDIVPGHAELAGLEIAVDELFVL
jgi:Uma2 family endonuclease